MKNVSNSKCNLKLKRFSDFLNESELWNNNLLNKNKIKNEGLNVSTTFPVFRSAK
jgi:hypothetical protein